MGEISKESVIDMLVAENPKARRADLVIYADAFLEYKIAQANIAEHGAVVAHPRTAAPIDNPYIKTRDRASKLLRSMPRIKADDLWS